MALNERSARLVSMENLTRCKNKIRGSNIKTVMASDVSNTRYMREVTIYLGVAVIRGCMHHRLPANHNVYLLAQFF